MEQQNYSSSYNTGNTSSQSASGQSATAQAQDKMNAVKDRVTEQAGAVKDKLAQQANTIGNQVVQKIDSARGKTSQGLRTTSERIQNLAMYVEEHDAKDMSDAVVKTSTELVRKYPGRSLLAGLVVGMLVGRIFSMGMGGHHQR